MTIIKRYNNRKLYNTTLSVYMEYEDLIKMIKDGDEFVVLDYQTKEDITVKALASAIGFLGKNSTLFKATTKDLKEFITKSI